MLLLIRYQLFPSATKNTAGQKLLEQDGTSLAGHFYLLPTLQFQLTPHLNGNHDSS